MKNQPLVSVIMNCYNGEKYLAEAIESVLNQTYKNVEIIFWDNISTDKSTSIVASYNDDRIKYFLAEKHTSLGEARNCALEKVNGDYISFLDVDDLWKEEKLAFQVKQMRENPHLILSYSFSYEFYHQDLNSKKYVKFSEHKQDKIFFSLMKKNYINWQTVMIKVDNEKHTIKFDPQFEFLEDLDILLLLSLQGEFGLLKKPLIYCRKHDSNLSLKKHDMLKERFVILNKYKKYFTRNKAAFYKIYFHYFAIYLYNKLQYSEKIVN